MRNWEVAMSSDAMPQTFHEDVVIDGTEVLSRDARLQKPQVKRSTNGKVPMGKRLPCDRSMSLHVSKLRGISFDVRAKLKRNGVTYTHQLLSAAGNTAKRHEFSETSGIEEMTLARLTCRADLARIKGIGAIFADMLELLDVDRVVKLAHQDPEELHDALYTLNSAERFARRAPTPEEVEDWVSQARALPKLVAAEG
jgi:predicted flap endonuclease-1-like 5' DNA nuclease